MLLFAFLQGRIEELIIKKVHLLFVDCLRKHMGVKSIIHYQICD